MSSTLMILDGLSIDESFFNIPAIMMENLEDIFTALAVAERTAQLARINTL